MLGKTAKVYSSQDYTHVVLLVLINVPPCRDASMRGSWLMGVQTLCTLSASLLVNLKLFKKLPRIIYSTPNLLLSGRPAQAGALRGTEGSQHRRAPRRGYLEAKKKKTRVKILIFKPL